MRRIFITGMSGTGKSTVIQELASRGYRAVDADGKDFSHLVDVPDEELTGPGPGKDWVWREDRMESLLAEDDGAGVLFVSGCSPNQGKFYPRFDRIVLLSAPPSLIAERLKSRTNNQFGKDAGELARTLALQETIEPALRQIADVEIDTTAPLEEVVQAVLREVDA